MICRLVASGVLAATLLSCGGGSSPTAPPAVFSVLIAGGFVTIDGGLLEATILFDGVEVEGARIACPFTAGCATRDLNGTTTASAGRHTVSFQVIRHTRSRDGQPFDGRIEYTVLGQVVVSRLGSPGQSIGLPERTQRLGPGESVDYTITIEN